MVLVGMVLVKAQKRCTFRNCVWKNNKKKVKRPSK